MEPTYRPGDYVIARSQDRYQEGDIVVFKVQGGMVVHRIVGGSPEHGFHTKGDNNLGIDPWQPRPEVVLGEAWLHVPRIGNLIAKIQAPLGLGAVAGTVTFLMLMVGPAEEGRHRSAKRKHRRPPARRRRNPRNRGWLMVGIGGLAVLGFAALTVRAYLLPTHETRLAEGLRYQHNVEFVYTARVEPSTVYQSESIGPVASSGEAGNATVTAPPLYTRLVRGIDLDFQYTLTSPHPLDIQGELKAVITIQAGDDGWTRTLPLMAAEAFTGTTISAAFPVDVDEVLALIAMAEEETGFRPGLYRVSVIPHVSIAGSVGESAVEDTFWPAFTMEIAGDRIVPTSELASSRITTVSGGAERLTEVRLLGLQIGVAQLRWIGAIGLAVCLLLTGATAAVAHFGLGRDETARIRTRYGSILVPVEHIELGDKTKRIEVGSITDLARLARSEHQMIFLLEEQSGSRIYFVPDGETVYEYTGTGSKKRGGGP